MLSAKKQLRAKNQLSTRNRLNTRNQLSTNNKLPNRTVLKLLVGVLAYTLSHSAVMAEYFGLPSGRTANIDSMPDTSIEAGYVTGEISEIDYDYFGARFNYKFSPEAVVFIDFGQADADDINADGQGFGIGVFYAVDGIIESADFAVKATFHKMEFESKSGRGGSEDTDIITVEALFSGAQLGTSELGWYANVGMHKFDVLDYDETEFGFGGGVVKALGVGEVYFGADLIDELTFGFGFRYHL